MTINKTTTDLSTLKINYLTQEMYENALENDEINENELYVTPGGEGGGGSIDATSIPTANKVAKFDSTAHMNSEDMSSTEINSFVENLGYTFNLIDIFYPVGSYYETSDTSFNPNTAWGGTWILVTKDPVTFSSGNNITMPATTETKICTINLDAGKRYLLIGTAGAGVAASALSSTSIGVQSGTYNYFYSCIVNSVTASAGRTLPAMAYIETNTACVAHISKYNYGSSAISTAWGHIVAIPLINLQDGNYKWHRTA